MRAVEHRQRNGNERTALVLHPSTLQISVPLSSGNVSASASDLRQSSGAHVTVKVTYGRVKGGRRNTIGFMDTECSKYLGDGVNSP